MEPPENILVPVDFSPTSDGAVVYAQTFSTAFRARVHVLHVIPDPHIQPWTIEATGTNLAGLIATWEADANQRLARLDLGTSSSERVTKVGQPYLEIITYAKAHAIDLIVMGTHGRGGIKHLLLGSVAEKVVRAAPCPVLNVRLTGTS